MAWICLSKPSGEWLITIYMTEYYQVTEFDSFGSQGKWLDEFAEIADDFDVIVHAGALMQAGYDKPDLFWLNYETTCKLVDAYPDKHFIFFSSSMAVSPVNFYGWSKRCASDYVMADLLPSLKAWGSLTDLWVRPEGRPCRISASARFATCNWCGLTISPQTFYVSACPAATV